MPVIGRYNRESKYNKKNILNIYRTIENELNRWRFIELEIKLRKGSKR